MASRSRVGYGRTVPRSVKIIGTKRLYADGKFNERR